MIRPAARFALWGGKRLPYDAEVEFLQGDGSAFVNTGIVVAEGDVITCTMAVASSYGTTYGYFGASDGTGQYLGGGSSCLSPFSDRRFSVWRKNDLFWCAQNVTNTYQDEALHTLRIDISTTAPTVSIDGANISYSTSYHSGQNKMPEYPQYIFAINSAGSAKIAPASTNLRFATFKIERNGVALIDLVSVRKGTVGYLYDRVSGKLFGNAGTGDFVLGPDVVPVEYIESHGTEWIDTGVIGYKTTKVESHCALLNASSGYPAMWGARTGSRNNDFQIYYNTPTIGGSPSSIVLRTGNSDKSVSTSAIGVNTFIGTRLDVVAADGALSVNGYDFSTPAFSNFTTPHSILMFCEYSVNAPSNFGSFVYWGMKMWQADSIVRSFLPIRVGTEGAMMDVLTRRIYRNAGTGAFTYGNDLKYPIPAS